VAQGADYEAVRILILEMNELLDKESLMWQLSLSSNGQGLCTSNLVVVIPVSSIIKLLKDFDAIELWDCLMSPTLGAQIAHRLKISLLLLFQFVYFY